MTPPSDDFTISGKYSRHQPVNVVQVLPTEIIVGGVDDLKKENGIQPAEEEDMWGYGREGDRWFCTITGRTLTEHPFLPSTSDGQQ